MRRVISIVVAVLLAATAGIAGEPEHHGPAPSTDPRLEFLKSLAGSWVATDGPAEMADSRYEFRVTAGGHAVEEREMIGTPMEMLTVYAMEGKDLVATHYCMLGNQPRLKAEPKVVDDTLGFACAGAPGNAASHDDEHVHGWAMRLDGKGKLHYSAELVSKGSVTEAPAVVLTRTRETASR